MPETDRTTTRTRTASGTACTDLTWSGAIGDDYSFDENGDVVGLSNVVVQVLPVAQRNDDNLGYEVLGPAAAP